MTWCIITWAGSSPGSWVIENSLARALARRRTYISRPNESLKNWKYEWTRMTSKG